MAAQSWLAPLVLPVLLPAQHRVRVFEAHVALFRPSSQDMYRRLLHRALLWQLPHTVAAAYFALRVLQTGLDGLGVLSILTGAVSLCYTVGVATWKAYKERSVPGIGVGADINTDTAADAEEPMIPYGALDDEHTEVE